MVYYKNARLKKVKGGYIISCDKVIKSKNAYDGYSHVGTKEEVFQDGEEALEKLDELYKSEMEYNSASVSEKVAKEANDDY